MGGSLEDAVGPVVTTALISTGSALLWPVPAGIVCAGMLGTGILATRRPG